MASPPDATLAAELAGEMDAHVAADQAACAEAAAEAAPPTKAACGKCKVEHETADMISRAGYRPDLRYVCKACNATTTTLTRKGIQVQHLLDESSMVAFFSEAALERRNAQENRITFGQTRALLKRTMVKQVMQVKKDMQESEWQPLSYFELKGYDVAAIERDCPCEMHPVLGATYKLAIHTESEGTVVKEVEERIAEMENETMQRRAAVTAAAAGVPQMDLECIVEKQDTRKRKGGPMTTEEKEEKKQQRLAEKQLLASTKVATAAAAKHFAGLKAVRQKLGDKQERLGTSFQELPADLQDQVAKAIKDLDETTAFCGKLLDAAAKGTNVGAPLLFQKEKELQLKIKSGNTALRSVHDYLRGDKENVKGKGRGRGVKK
jgi:hypothetical protein